MSNVEYIEQARKMLINDYKIRHNDEYNAWRFNTQNAWRGENIPLPFPPFIYNPVLAPFQSTIPYPTEDQIAAKALELFKQTGPADSVDDVAPVAEEPTVEPAAVAEPAPTDPEIEPELESVVPAEEPVAEEATVDDTAETVDAEPTPVVEQPQAEPDPYVAEIQDIYKDVYQDYLENKIIIAEEPVVEQPTEQVTEPVVVEPTIVEQEPEPVVAEPVAETDPYVSKIQEIYKDLGAAPADAVDDGVIPEVKTEPVPMPAEQLAKASQAGERLLPSVLRKIEELKTSWASKK